MITKEQHNHIISIMPLFDWRDIANKLKAQIKAEAPLSWYYIIKQNGDWIYESNSEGPYIGPKENTAIEGEEYLHLDLMNLDMPLFKELTEYAASLDNVNYVGFHCLGPNSKVAKHSDVNEYSFIINLSIKENDPDNVYLDVGGKRYSFSEGEEFLFDGDLEHYAVNTSDKDWIMFAMRFSK